MAPVVNPEPVKSYLLNFAWVWHYIGYLKKDQDSNQGHVTFLMTPSYFKAIFETKYFCEWINFSICKEISL